MFTAAPSTEVVRVDLPLSAVRDGLRLLRASRELADEKIEMVGYIDAINHSRRTIGVRENRATGIRKKPRNYSGKIDSGVTVVGLPTGPGPSYQISIIRETTIAEFDDGEPRYSYRLTAIAPIDGTMAVGTATADQPSE
jgi:hypothetical protein